MKLIRRQYRTSDYCNYGYLGQIVRRDALVSVDLHNVQGESYVTLECFRYQIAEITPEEARKIGCLLIEKAAACEMVRKIRAQRIAEAAAVK
jgi:hypothetical protein